MVAKGIVKFSAQKLPKEIDSHDLGKLHTRSKAAATIAPYLLDGLTYMTTWRARYPFPPKVEDFWPMDDKGNLKAGGFDLIPIQRIAHLLR